MKAIALSILLWVSIFLLSVTKLCDMHFHQYVCESCMGHTKHLDPISAWKIARKLDIDLPVTVTAGREWQELDYIHSCTKEDVNKPRR